MNRILLIAVLVIVAILLVRRFRGGSGR